MIRNCRYMGVEFWCMIKMYCEVSNIFETMADHLHLSPAAAGSSSLKRMKINVLPHQRHQNLSPFAIHPLHKRQGRPSGVRFE